MGIKARIWEDGENSEERRRKKVEMMGVVGKEKI